MWKPCGLDVARLTISTRAWDASRLLPEMYIKPFHSGRPATSRRIVAPLGCQEPMARGRILNSSSYGFLLQARDLGRVNGRPRGVKASWN